MANPTGDGEPLCYNADRAQCRVCGKKGLPCARCRLDYYCGKEHQRADWQRHKVGCGALEVREDAELGRHLVLTQDVPAGTVLLRELPLVVMAPPWTISRNAMCVGCLRSFVSFSVQCARCGWPVCGAACSRREAHQAECKAFERAGFKLTKAARDAAGPLLWTAFYALRTHLAFQAHPRLQRLQARHKQPLPAPGVRPSSLGVYTAINWHAELSAATRQDEHWPAAARWLREVAGLDFLDEEDLVRAAGVNDINVIDVDPLNIAYGTIENADVSLLFSAASLAEHACVPTGLVLAQESATPNYEHLVVATRDLRRGDHLSLDYVVSAFQDAATRRALLRRAWSFVCRCAFCRDPTSAGRHIGAPCCPRCTLRGERRLVVAESEPTETGEVLRRCQGCGAPEEDLDVAEQLARHERRLAKLKSGPAEYEDFDRALKGMLWPKGVLHPDHRHALNGRLGGFLFLSGMVGADLQIIPESKLAPYVDKVQHILDAMAAVKPGLSLHQCVMLRAKFDLLICNVKSGPGRKPPNAVALRERILQLEELLELLRPYFISPLGKKRFKTLYQDFVQSCRQMFNFAVDFVTAQKGGVPARVNRL